MRERYAARVHRMYLPGLKICNGPVHCIESFLLRRRRSRRFRPLVIHKLHLLNPKIHLHPVLRAARSLAWRLACARAWFGHSFLLLNMCAASSSEHVDISCCLHAIMGSLCLGVIKAANAAAPKPNA
eukprot:1160264-Pelagomonas_calceolata.AAC.2